MAKIISDIHDNRSGLFHTGLVRNPEKPSDMGVAALGSGKNSGNESDAAKELTGLTWKEASRKPIFWILVSAAILFGMSIQPVFLSAPAFLEDAGIPMKHIGLLMGIIYLMNLFGKITLGIVNDKFGISPVVLICHTAFIISVFVLFFANQGAVGYVFAALFGIASVALTIPIPLLTGTLFGQKTSARSSVSSWARIR